MKKYLFLILVFTTSALVAQKPDKYDRIIDSLQKKGQEKELIPFFQKELKTKPKDEKVLRRLAHSYLLNKELEPAEKYYREALAVNPNCDACYMNIGQIYLLKNEYRKALSYCDMAVGIKPDAAANYAGRALLRDYMGDNTGALMDHNKAVRLEPKNAGYLVKRAQFNSKQGYLSLALNDLSEAIEAEPDNYTPYFERASIYYNKQMPKEALADINKAIQLDSSRQEFYTGRASVYALLNEHTKAIADNTKAILLNPKDYLPYYNRSLEKYALEDMNGSCEDLNQANDLLSVNNVDTAVKRVIEYSIGNYCDTNQASYYYQRGIAAYNTGQYREALKHYDLGLKKFPGNCMALSFRGNAYYAMQEYTLALDDYYASIKNKDNLVNDVLANKKHLELNNGSTEHYLKGILSSMQISIAESHFALGHYSQALSEINKGIETAPNMVEFGSENYYNVRGNIYIALGKPEFALADFNKAIQLNANFAYSYVNRAVAKTIQAGNIKMTSFSVSGGINDQAFNANWTLPLKNSFKKSDATMISALSDCDKALEIDPNFGFAYFTRGQLKRLLQQNDYCYDLLKARELNYNIGNDLLNECVK